MGIAYARSDPTNKASGIKHTDSVIAFLRIAIQQMESGHIPCNLYIDLSKAFYTLSLDVLLNMLKYYGFVGTELNY